VSNTSLILGMVGAGSSSSIVLTAGIAGMLAGAMSMAAGEYISVRSQREVFEYQIELERSELAEHPEAERKELAIIYEAKGLNPEDADRVARTLIANPQLALDTMAREELGLNPDELGSPWGAASYSFVSFTLGALVPVLPFLLFNGIWAIGIAIVMACTCLFLVGSALSLFTGRSAWRSGFRMLGIGVGAGLITYLIGNALNMAVII
ncbi:MAG: VIT1/CCC1 transporter family protein, partial [Burkholderiaceae bacterium]